MTKGKWLWTAVLPALALLLSVSCSQAADPAPAAGAPAAAAAGDWPKWLGPDGNGISTEKIADEWPEAGPKKLWSAKVGQSYSSVVAKGGKVYFFATNEGKDVLTCFEADTGKVVWSESYPGAYSKDYPGTRTTPTIEGDRIYTYGGAGQLVARELATGKQVWMVEVLKLTNSQNLLWGLASSPLIYNDMIVVQSGVGGSIAVAVNKADGKPVWQSEAKGIGGYATVIVADVAGKPQLIVFAGSGLHGMDPATGKTLWQQPWKSQDDITATTPVYDGKGNLFISTGDGLGKSGMFQLSATEAKKLWEKPRDFRSKFSAPILEGDTMYMVTEEGRGWIKSMSWPDGKLNYEMRKPALGYGGSILRIGGDKLIAQAQTGEVYLIQATPKAGKIISTFTPFEEAKEVWTNPVVYQGKLYLKGAEELVCFDVK